VSAAPPRGGLTQALGAVKKTPRFWIEHTESWRNAPMAFWVHLEKGKEPWYSATDFDPPAPLPDGKLGYRVLCVESQKMVFRFTSLDQLNTCIQTLSQKPLPSTKRLAAQRNAQVGPNSHWLSSLPANVKSAKGRTKVVQDLSSVVHAIGT
jgi:hypothetical protein